MNKDLVSIIVPTYNQSEFIVPCIESALQQTYENIEIIIVNDGSDDNTESIVKNTFTTDKVRYFYKKNGGPASARNYGIKQSTGEFISFLDSDDLWTSAKIETQINYFRTNPSVSLVFSTPYVEGREGEDYVSIIGKRLKEGTVFEQLLKGNFIHTSTVILRKSILEDTGCFDEDPQLISVEDYNLWLRIAQKYQFGFSKELASKKGLHENSFTHDYDRMFKADFYNLSKLAESYPEWDLKKNAAYNYGYANYLYKYGDSLFFDKRYNEARKYLWRCLVMKPFFKRVIPLFLLSILPSGIVNFLREKRHAS